MLLNNIEVRGLAPPGGGRGPAPPGVPTDGRGGQEVRAVRQVQEVTTAALRGEGDRRSNAPGGARSQPLPPVPPSAPVPAPAGAPVPAPAAPPSPAAQPKASASPLSAPAVPPPATTDAAGSVPPDPSVTPPPDRRFGRRSDRNADRILPERSRVRWPPGWARRCAGRGIRSRRYAASAPASARECGIRKGPHHVRHDADPPRDDPAACRLERRLAEALARRTSESDRRGQSADARHRAGHPDGRGGAAEESVRGAAGWRTRRRARPHSPPLRSRPRQCASGRPPPQLPELHAPATQRRARRRRLPTTPRPARQVRRAAGRRSQWQPAGRDRRAQRYRSSARRTPRSICRTCSRPCSRRPAASAARCRSRSARTAGSTRRPTTTGQKSNRWAAAVRRRTAPPGTTVLPDWIVVTTEDPAGSGLKFGIARPVGESLNELRRAGVRNAGLGLGVHRPRAHRHRPAVVAADAQPLEAQRRRPPNRGRRLQRARAGRIERRDRPARPRLQPDGGGRRTPSARRRRAGADSTGARARPADPARHASPGSAASGPDGDPGRVGAGARGRRRLLQLLCAQRRRSGAARRRRVRKRRRRRAADGEHPGVAPHAARAWPGSGRHRARDRHRHRRQHSRARSMRRSSSAMLNPATRVLRYVNAGHNQQYVLRRDGSLEEMSSSGLPVGLLAGHGYAEARVQLEAGDLLFFYTDGCVESENEQRGDVRGRAPGNTCWRLPRAQRICSLESRPR